MDLITIVHIARIAGSVVVISGVIFSIIQIRWERLPATKLTDRGWKPLPQQKYV
jgi:hypothetical protein